MGCVGSKDGVAGSPEASGEKIACEHRNAGPSQRAEQAQPAGQQLQQQQQQERAPEAPAGTPTLKEIREDQVSFEQDVTVRGLSVNWNRPYGDLPGSPGANGFLLGNDQPDSQFKEPGYPPEQSSAASFPDPNSAASFPDPKLLRLRTEDLSSAATSNSLVEDQGLLYPLCDLDNPNSKADQPQPGAFIGFDVAGGQPRSPQQASPVGPSSVNGSSMWRNAPAAPKLPKLVPVSPQPASPVMSSQPSQSQGSPSPEQQQQQQQQPLWLSTLTAPKYVKDNNAPSQSPAGLPSPPPGLLTPTSSASGQSGPQLVIPRWSACTSNATLRSSSTTDPAAPSSKEGSARSSNESAKPYPTSHGWAPAQKANAPHPSPHASLTRRSASPSLRHQSMSRLGFVTGPRACTMELPHTEPIMEQDSGANSLSCGANISFSQSFLQPGMPHKSGPLVNLHKSLENLLLQDKAIAEQVHASMRGIVSLAKETNQLDFGQDASGATCINQYVVVKTLGRGSFGKVKLCLNTMDGQMYAIKMVNRSLILKQLQKPSRNLRKRGPRCSIDSQKANGTTPSTQHSLMSRAGRAAASLDLPRPHMKDGKPVDSISQLLVDTPRSSFDDSHSIALESMMREIAVLKKLDHPHVVKLHEVIDSPSATYMMLVMEFMEQGPVLDTKAQTGFERYPEAKAVHFFRQACLGLDYLHYNHVVHGDLKPENLLVNAEGKLKISDFGSSRIISETSTSSKVSCTPAFQPPEALTWGFTEDPITSDIWALGVCLYCFIYGRLPFTGSCVLDITNSITNDVLMYPREVPISAALQDLLGKLLDKNPAKRATLMEAMEHPWVTLNGSQPLSSMASLTSPPKVVEVSKDEAKAAVMQSPLVNMIRTKLKEKHVDRGSFIFREGETANCVFMIMSGAVELIQHLNTASQLDASTLDEMDHSFSVDLDESFALEDGHELIPAAMEGLDMKNGMLHVNRQRAQELKKRMKALLMGKQEDYVMEVKGPGQVFGEVSLNAAQAVQYSYSARARTDKVVVVKLTEEAMLRGLLQQLSGDGRNAEDSGALSFLVTADSHVVAQGPCSLQTIQDDQALDVQGW